MSKTISPALQQFLLQPTLKNGETYADSFGRADLISITLPNSDTLNVVYGTNRDITYLGTTYYASKYGAWERGAFANQATYKPSADDSMELTALLPDTILYPGTTTPMIQTVNTAVWSGATVQIQTLFWPQDGKPEDGILMFTQTSPPIPPTMRLTTGSIGNVTKTGRSKVTFELFSMLYILNRPVPPYQIQSQCRHALYDLGCTLLQSNFTSTPLTLDSASSTLVIVLDTPSWAASTNYVFGNIIAVGSPIVYYMCTTAGESGLLEPSFNSARGVITVDHDALWTSMNGAYQLGHVTFTSGQNDGFNGQIKAQSGNQFTLSRPMPFGVVGGDTLQLIPGCDKSLVTCATFNNTIHFGGTPFVPNPEVAA